MKLNKLVVLFSIIFLNYNVITLAQTKSHKKAKIEDASDAERSDAPAPQTSKGRKEIELKHASDEVFTIPIGENGVLVFGESDERSKDGNKPWNFIRYGTSFKEELNTNYDVDKDVKFFKYFFDKSAGYIYILFGQKTKLPGGETNSMNSVIHGDIQIVRYNVANDKLSSFKGTLPVNSTLNSFVVKNGVGYFGGNTAASSGKVCARQCLIYSLCCIPGFMGATHIPYHPTLYTFSFKEKKINLETLNYEGDASVLNIASSNEDQNEVSAAVANRKTTQDIAKVVIKNYDGTKLTSTYKLKMKDENEITDASVYKVDENIDLVFGSFATPRAKLSFFEKIKEFDLTYTKNSAEGFFIARFSGGKQTYLKSFPFSKYLTVTYEKQALFKKKQTEEVAFTGKGMDFILQNVIKQDDDNYILVGDFFQKYYHTEAYYDGKNWHYRTVFDGWGFFAGIICSFNITNGTMNWANTLQPNYKKDEGVPLTFNPKGKITLLQNENNANIVAAYSNGSKIVSKIIRPDGSVKNGKSKSFDVALTNESDKSVSSRGDIDYWYGNYFVAYGVQRIKTKGKLIGGRRTVFYINKIKYDYKKSDDDE